MAFNLDSIRKGKMIHAPRIFMYSTHGIGKSTFAANASDPIFICTEDGLGSIDTGISGASAPASLKLRSG